jgi:dolichol-phosphate mannosyltransferase
MTNRHISVIVPVYSETESLRRIVGWLLDHLRDRLLEILLVVSPESTDESKRVCASLAGEHPEVHVHVQQENPGLGRAIRQGFRASRGRWVLMIDADGEMEIEAVPRMIAAMEQGDYGLIVASRWLRGGGFQGYGRLKYVLNWTFQQVFRVLFRTSTHDLTYGCKLIRGDLARQIPWEATLHEICCETTLRPIRLGVAVAEVPCVWTARKQGVSKNTFWRNLRYLDTAIHVLFWRPNFEGRNGE